MKKTFIILCLMTVSSLAYSQVGINTSNPQGVLHVDGAKDNPSTGVPNVAQQANDFTVTSAGSVGIGTTAPTNTLDVAGTARIRTMGTAAGATVITPVYSDVNGVLNKAVNTNYGAVINNNTATVASGATVQLITGLAGNTVYKAVIRVGDGCGNVSVTEFMIHSYSFNNFYGISGLNGAIGAVGTGTNYNATFTQNSRFSVSVTWAAIGCADGANGTGHNYTLTMPSATVINITNNANVSRGYGIVLTRLY